MPDRTWRPCCPFCQRPGLPCRDADKAECAERERGYCSCRSRIGTGTDVLTPYGTGTVTDPRSYVRGGQPVAQVEIPRVLLDQPVPPVAPHQVSIHPADSWAAAHPGPQRAYVWYPVTRIHLPGCWQLAAGSNSTTPEM